MSELETKQTAGRYADELERALTSRHTAALNVLRDSTLSPEQETALVALLTSLRPTDGLYSAGAQMETYSSFNGETHDVYRGQITVGVPHFYHRTVEDEEAGEEPIIRGYHPQHLEWMITDESFNKTEDEQREVGNARGGYRAATPTEQEAFLADLTRKEFLGSLSETEQEVLKVYVRDGGLKNSETYYWGTKKDWGNADMPSHDIGMLYMRDSTRGAQDDLVRVRSSGVNPVNVALDALKHARLSPGEVLQLRGLLSETTSASLGNKSATKRVGASFVRVGSHDAVEMPISVNGKIEQVILCPWMTAADLTEASKHARDLGCIVATRAVTDALTAQLLGMERALPITAFSKAEMLALHTAYSASSICYSGGRAALKDGEVKHFDQNSGPHQGFYLLQRRQAAN